RLFDPIFTDEDFARQDERLGPAPRRHEFAVDQKLVGSLFGFTGKEAHPLFLLAEAPLFASRAAHGLVPNQLARYLLGATMTNPPTIIYTETDEAPALATYSLLPIIQAFTKSSGVHVETRDISL